MLISRDSTAERLAQAEVWKMQGKHDDALGLLEELLIEDPANVTALEEVAENELRLGHYDRAALAARRALKLSHASYVGHYVLGFLKAREGKWSVAVRELSTANRIVPHTPEILRCLGYALYRSGKRLEGLVTLERALNLDDENTQILCTLGTVYLQARSPRKARGLFAQALAIDPTCTAAKQGMQLVRPRRRKA